MVWIGDADVYTLYTRDLICKDTLKCKWSKRSFVFAKQKWHVAEIKSSISSFLLVKQSCGVKN